jgi:ABC-type transport system involved in multi-copper enzyme maturation permease subunit
MKTIIRKELRENLILGVLGFVIFSLMLLQHYRDSSSALKDVASQFYYGQNDTRMQPLLSLGLVPVGFFCAIFGALLGWKQIFVERHRDLHAFLIHRPIRRTQIFWAKTAAGITVYLLATGIPLLCLVAWTRYPGHVAAPFERRMTVPGFSFCASGLVFYFAGILTGLRQARWYVSRGLGLAAAAVVCLAILISSSLWQPVAAVGIGLVVVATAAWGAFKTSGYYQGQPAGGKATLIVSLSVGSAVVLVFLIGLGSTFISGKDVPWTYYTMSTNGVIYKITHSRGKPPEIVDLDGKELLDEKTGRTMQLSEFNRRIAPGAALNVDFEPSPPRGFADPSRYFLIWGTTPDTIWYYWSKYGRLVGYDLLSRRIVGSIGPNGFVAETREGLDRFKPPLNHNSWARPNLLHTADTVYDPDLAARVVKTAFKTTTDDPIGGAISVQVSKESEEDYSVLAATRRQIYLIRPDGATAWKIPYQPAYPDYAGIRLSMLPQSKQVAVWIGPSLARSFAKSFKLPTHVI